MQPENQIEELALIDERLPPFTGPVFIRCDGTWVNEGRMKLPDYLHPTEGYVHMHQIINGMDEGTAFQYSMALERIICGKIRDHWAIDRYRSIAMDKATVAQTAEAILRAVGEWNG